MAQPEITSNLQEQIIAHTIQDRIPSGKNITYLSQNPLLFAKAVSRETGHVWRTQREAIFAAKIRPRLPDKIKPYFMELKGYYVTKNPDRGNLNEFLVLPQIDPKELYSNQRIKEADERETDKVAKTAAHVLAGTYFTELDDVTVEFLTKEDEREQSSWTKTTQSFKERFNQRTERMIHVVEGEDFYVGKKPHSSDEVLQLSRQVYEDLDKLTSFFPQSDKKYFVHNDPGLTNMSYGDEPKIFDTEHVYYTHVPVLAAVIEAGKYYSRGLWNWEFANKFALYTYDEMVKVFEDQKNNASTFDNYDSRELAYRFTRSAIIFGTILLSTYTAPVMIEKYKTSVALGGYKKSLEELEKKHKQL